MTDFELYQYQKEDVSKLADRKGRLIAAEMGTGKTYEAAALDAVSCQDSHDNTLWVGPMTTLAGSADKMRETGFDGDIFILDPKNRPGTIKKFKQANGAVLMMHWEALRLMPELREIKWQHIVADECHRMQNRKAQQTQALKKIKAPFKTAMSGTPVTGEPNKYWSVLNWLYPHTWTSYWKFYERFVDFKIVYPQGYHQVVGPKNEHELLAEIDPYYVRHMKREKCCEHHPQGVMPWLPDKYYTEVNVELGPKQRKAYTQMEKEMLSWVGAHEQSPLVASVVVAQMMRLQQFALAYADLGPEGNVQLVDPSAKADAIMQILEDNPDEPVVIFTQFTQFIHLLQDRLKKAKITYSTYTGENRANREAEKVSFVKGNTRVMLGTIAAGGVGVDGLQDVCSTMIFADRMWNPALNQQAEDRLWRGGQSNAVQIIDIMAKDTVDLGRKQRLELKWNWIRRLLGDV